MQARDTYPEIYEAQTEAIVRAAIETRRELGTTVRVLIMLPLISNVNEMVFLRKHVEPVIRLSRKETRGTSVTCPRCGERLQEDKRIRRKVWCGKCRVVMDRDVVAAVNLSWRGRLRFDRSRAQQGLQGRAVEAMKGNPTTTVILRVDALKSVKEAQD